MILLWQKKQLKGFENFKFYESRVVFVDKHNEGDEELDKKEKIKEIKKNRANKLFKSFKENFDSLTPLEAKFLINSKINLGDEKKK